MEVFVADGGSVNSFVGSRRIQKEAIKNPLLGFSQQQVENHQL